MQQRLRFLTILSLAAVASAPAQHARNAKSAAILAFHAFPEADGVRPIRRDICTEARRRIENSLPFKVHFEEIGAHELYVAFRGKRPVGMLYCRSEETEWGLTDIGWAMSLERRIVGFEFASSRSPKAGQLARSPFAKSLVGLDFAGLRQLHEAPATPARETDAGLTQLSHTVLRSALKATIVTEIVWRDEVDQLADIAMLLEEFPGAAHRRRAVASLTAPTDDAPPRRLASLRYMQASSRRRIPLGSVARTTVHLGDSPIALRWVLDSNLTILAIKPVTSWPDDELRLACSRLNGCELNATDLPPTPLTPAARELARELAALTRPTEHR